MIRQKNKIKWLRDDREHCIIIITSTNMQRGNNYGLEINGRCGVNPEEIIEGI